MYFNKLRTIMGRSSRIIFIHLYTRKDKQTPLRPSVKDYAEIPQYRPPRQIPIFASLLLHLVMVVILSLYFQRHSPQEYSKTAEMDQKPIEVVFMQKKLPPLPKLKLKQTPPKPPGPSPRATRMMEEEPRIQDSPTDKRYVQNDSFQEDGTIEQVTEVNTYKPNTVQPNATDAVSNPVLNTAASNPKLTLAKKSWKEG